MFKTFITAAVFMLASSIAANAQAPPPKPPADPPVGQQGNKPPANPLGIAANTANMGGSGGSGGDTSPANACYDWVLKIYGEKDHWGNYTSFDGLGWVWQEVDCSTIFPPWPDSEPGGGGLYQYEIKFPDQAHSHLDGDCFDPPLYSSGGHLHWSTPAGAEHDREWGPFDPPHAATIIKQAVCSFLGIPNVESDPVPMAEFSDTINAPWWLTGKKDLIMTQFQYRTYNSPPLGYWDGHLIRITGVSEVKARGAFPNEVW